MIVLHVAKSAREWREAVAERAGYGCEAVTHDPQCGKFPEMMEAHHIVFRAHLSKESLWIVENGAWLVPACHRMAHALHNRNIAREKLDIAVAAVNCIETIKVPHFSGKVKTA